jgi:hypothetical protein
MTAPGNSAPRRAGGRLRKVVTVVLIISAVIASPLLLLQLSYVVGTAKMVAIADRMQPAPGWAEDGENISGGLFCISVAVPCDSMWRQYRTQLAVTPADVQRISDETGLQAPVVGDCETSPLPPNVTGLYEACSAKDVVDGYDAEVRVLKFGADDPDRLIQFRLSNIRNR